MEEKTVTVGETEVQITETEDGFEVEEAEPDPGSVEKFIEETGIDEGHNLRYGSVEEINDVYGGVRIDVSNETHDEMHSTFFDIIVDSEWSVYEVDFDNGHINFEDTDE